MSSSLSSVRPRNEYGRGGSRPVPGRLLSAGIRAVTLPLTFGVSAITTALFVLLAALTSRTVQRFLLAVVILNMPLQIAKHFFLQQDAEEWGCLGGLEVSLLNLALAGLYVGWMLSSRPGVPPPQRIRDPIGVPVFLFFLFNALSAVVATNVALSVFEILIVLELSLLYFYIANAVTSRDDVLFIFRLLIIGLVFEGLLMSAQAFGLLGDFNFLGLKAKAQFLDTSNNYADRISGTIGAPNSSAAYLGMVMAAALGVMLANVRRLDKYLAGIALTLAIIPLISTMSRGGWLSFLMSLATVLFFGNWRVNRKPLIAAAAIMVLVTLPFASTIEERFTADDKGSAHARAPLNKMAGLMIMDHPVLGVGVNNFPVVMESYLSRGFVGEWLYSVHCKYLAVWSETGTFGFIAFLWFLIAIIRQGSRCWQLRDPLLGPLALGCVAAVLGHMGQMLIDTFRGGPENHLLYLYAALTTAMTRLSVIAPLDNSRWLR
jgi:putative inorganic carbon (hco3(-)) transporter